MILLKILDLEGIVKEFRGFSVVALLAPIVANESFMDCYTETYVAFKWQPILAIWRLH